VTYRFLEHTADCGLEVEAESRERLFAEALAGLTDTITELARVEERERRDLAVAAASFEDLLVEWLGELVFRFETEGLLFRRAEVAIAGEPPELRLAATAWGEAYDPRRHPLKVLVKAVTHHRLEVTATDAGWRAQVLLDI
jgi:SHS2 domain-containing protein